MCLLAIRLPIGMRKITLTLQKIATSTFFDTGCLMSTTHPLPIFSWRTKAGKIFQVRALFPCSLALWLALMLSADFN